MNNKHNIIIVDDHKLFAHGLKRILDEEPDLYVTGICNGGAELFHMLNSTIPDVLILDVQMAGMGGIEICQKVKEKWPAVKVVFISMFENPKVLHDCRQAGANGFIPKSTDAERLIADLRMIAEGTDVYIAAKEPEKTATEMPESGSVLLLSNREKEVIQLIKKGYTSKMIAGELFLSQYTVETHRKNILKKLNISSVSELISFAFEHNI